MSRIEMSRPHNGQRPFLPFGNPFRMILPRGSHLSPELLAILNSFEQTLAGNLRNLKPKDASDARSLSWMTRAMEFLSKTHTNIKTLITDLQFPVSDWDEKWVDIYLDSSVKLLDICIALSSELSRLEQGQLLIQYALHLINSTNELQRVNVSLYDWKQLASSRSPKLASCLAILQGLGGTLYLSKIKNSAKGRVLMRVLYGVKVVTLYICGVLMVNLSGDSKQLTELRVPGKFRWAEDFENLQADVSGAIKSQLSNGKGTMVKEMEAVEVCVEALYALTGCDERSKLSEEGREKLSDFALELSGAAERLTGEVDLLSQRVGDFFQIVLTGRDALLCNFRDSGVMKEEDHEEQVVG